jgi:hypothetical protein
MAFWEDASSPHTWSWLRPTQVDTNIFTPATYPCCCTTETINVRPRDAPSIVLPSADHTSKPFSRMKPAPSITGGFALFCKAATNWAEHSTAAKSISNGKLSPWILGQCIYAVEKQIYPVRWNLKVMATLSALGERVFGTKGR